MGLLSSPVFLDALPFAALFALALFKGLLTGRMPTYRGSVDRTAWPVMFWLTGLIWIAAIGFTLGIPIRAEMQRERLLGQP